MPSVIENKLEVSSSMDLSIPYADYVTGIAIFDLNGLPKEYHTTSESINMSWVQAIFQALGLRSLLMSSMQLEGFQHATIYGSEYCAVVVKQRTHYVAMLVQKHEELIDDTFIQWAQQFQFSELRQNPRFHAA
jgi:hypothetical protein